MGDRWILTLVWSVFIGVASTHVALFTVWLVSYILMWRHIQKDERKYSE